MPLVLYVKAQSLNQTGKPHDQRPNYMQTYIPLPASKA